MKKYNNLIFKNTIFFAFLITASGMLKADDIKETAKKAFDQVKEKTGDAFDQVKETFQKLTLTEEELEEQKHNKCLEHCYSKYSSDDEKLFKWVCCKKCELTHQAREYKRALRKLFEKIKSK